MAFEVKAAISQLKDSIWIDCGSAIQAEISSGEAGVHELIIGDNERCKVEA